MPKAKLQSLVNPDSDFATRQAKHVCVNGKMLAHQTCIAQIPYKHLQYERRNAKRQ